MATIHDTLTAQAHQLQLRVNVFERAYCDLLANGDWSNYFSPDQQKRAAKLNDLEKQLKADEQLLLNLKFAIIKLAYKNWEVKNVR